MVIAVIVAANDDILPNGYMRKSATSPANKYLLRPITGEYNANFTNLFAENEFFVPLKTDSTGMVQFKDLAFSVKGNSGKFRIAFICDGVYSDPYTVNVQTSIARLRIINQLAPYILLEENENIRNDLSLILQVVDANGKLV